MAETPWTAGQIRKALEGLPDSFPVIVLTAGDDEQAVAYAEPWAHAEGTAEDVRARIAAGELAADHLEIGLEWPDA